MKNGNILGLISVMTIVAGFLLGYFSALEFEREAIHIDLEFSEDFSFDFGVFQYIFSRNATVAVLLSVGGYFTGGFLTVMVLLWNGVNLGTMFTLFRFTNLNIYEFISLFAIHGIFEFSAFVLFSIIGLRGFDFFLKIFKKQEFKVGIKRIDFVTPGAILLFAAMVETLLISNN